MTEQQAAPVGGAAGAFQREERYVVVKISKMHPHPTFRRRHLAALKEENAGALVDCVVVERDWPEYEAVWRMIEARVAGQAGSMVECPHRCGSVFFKESYGAGFIEGSGMCPTCDAAMPAKDIVNPGDEPTPPELLAAKLIDTWRVVYGRPVPWEKAVEITAIATSMSNEERERLLAMADAPATQAGQVPEVLLEAIKWADHLLFECGALVQTRAPSVHVYNQTYAAVEAAKALIAAVPAQGGE